MSDQPLEQQPEKIGRYQIIRELGRGGMAVVYLGLDPRIKREVAVKALPRQFSFSPDFRRRFQQEVEIIARLEHPAIVPVYDFGEDNDVPYIVMRYMPGGTLRQRMQGQPFTVQQASNLLARLAPALDKAHQQSIIHRDLKPDNILFDADGLPYLSDFGIARMAEATHTMTMIGTPAYMSPEQWESGKVDGRSDLYALGVIIFEMLTGQPPYSGDTPARLMRQHLLEAVPDPLTYNNQLAPGCQLVLRRALDKQPENRFPTASHLLTALQQVTQQAPAASLDAQATILEAELCPEPVASSIPGETVVPGEQPSILSPIGTKRRITFTWRWALLLVPLIALGIWGVWGSEENGNISTSTTPESLIAVTETATPTVATSTVDPTLLLDTTTNSPSATPSPSLTPTTGSTATSTPQGPGASVSIQTPTATFTPEFLARVVLSSINVRVGPGVVYGVVDILYANDEIKILARTEDGEWYLIEMPEGDLGWVAASVTETVADIDSLAVAATIPARPTNTPTHTPTHTPIPTSRPQGPTPTPQQPTPSPTIHPTITAYP